MITTKRALARAWQSYEKICDAEMPPYYHFSVAFRAAWIARADLKRYENRRPIRNKTRRASHNQPLNLDAPRLPLCCNPRRKCRHKVLLPYRNVKCGRSRTN